MILVDGLSRVIRSMLRFGRSDHPIDATENEESTLLRRSSYTPSLSDTYEGFEQSFTAFQLCIFHVICYYLIAVLCFSYFFENWTIIDSLYFATVLFTTIGFGDLSPSTWTGRMSVIFLAMYGIVLLGIFLGIAGHNLMEYQTKLWDRQRKDVRSKILRTVEQAAIERKETGDSQPSEPLESQRAVDVSLCREIGQVVLFKSPILFFVLMGGVMLGHAEGWNMFESIYFTVTAGTTIGFGDYHPDHPLVRLACCFFLPLLVAVLGQFLAAVASVYMKRQRRQAERKFLTRTMTIYDMQAMDENNDGEVQESEFLAFMLVALNKVNKDEITEIMSLFDRLDVSKSGTIDMKDLVVSKAEIFRGVLGDSTVPKGRR
ncbi:potassium channel subfamily K member 16 [Fistulifera solaris]|uniref:Potassium channel subfamily K member 16 n=1 Tax=Fistulifera solaris TaxID=1519565 RepID=A0A1Z5K544_FISSO|nr:potassium channel subfamily K member 16 [Fistulifera solaris]|eukprot:GAX21292.1 potassium channel subfamily K member 16 [Fistulifera solaris]